MTSLKRGKTRQARRDLCLQLLAISWSVLASGCVANSGWQTAKAPEGFVEGTRVLGELILSTTREQALTETGMLTGWSRKLRDLGYSDSDIADGSEVTVWAYCYGHNSGVPQCAHHGHYVVHVPEDHRAGLNFADDGDPDTSGDLVEIELVTTSSGEIVGKWVALYRSANDWGDCHIESLERGGLSTTLLNLGGVGPPRAIWLECAGAESDGWLRRPVRGAPPSRSTPVSEWIKLPAS